MAPAHRATVACARVSLVLVLVLVLCAAVSAAADPSDRLEDGRSELESGEHAEAAREFERGLEEALELDTAEGRGLALILRMDLADVYATYPDLGREADAEVMLLEAREFAERGLPPRHPTRVESVRRLGMYPW